MHAKGKRLKFIGKQREYGLPFIPRDAVITVSSSGGAAFQFKFNGTTWFGNNKDFVPAEPDFDTLSHLDSICEQAD